MCVCSERLDTICWLTLTFVGTLWFYGCVYMPACVCLCARERVPVESSIVADVQTSGCQQHTNKLSGENQSGL